MKSLYIIILLAATISCQPVEDSHSHGAHGHDHEGDHSEGEVHLSMKQLQTINLKMGSFTQRQMTGFIKANGVLDLPPSSIATVNAQEQGFVKYAGEFLVGTYVKKGTELLILEHPSYIEKQQKYLESLHELRYLQQELERQRQLKDANANALKKFQKAESEVLVMEAQMKGLEQYFKYIGISVDKLKMGDISQTISVKAPITGYITEVNVHKGMLVKPEMELYEVVDNQHMHLELDVFESDISNIKKGQSITFTVPALGDKEYSGDVHLIGKSFNTENKTVRIHGHIDGYHKEFIRGLYAEAKILLSDEMVEVLPEESIISDGESHYIFILNKNHKEEGELAFLQTEVTIGQKDGGFVAVNPIQPLPENAAIVKKGAFYLYAEMNKSTTHQHH